MGACETPIARSRARAFSTSLRLMHVLRWFTVVILSTGLFTIPAAAQNAAPEYRAAFSLSAVTKHGLGVGAEVAILRSVRLLARAEGPARRSALGAGLALDLYHQDDFRFYAAGLAGVLSCRRQGEIGCEGGEGSGAALAAISGAEFRLSQRWANALELAYWAPVGDSAKLATDYSDARRTLALVVRYMF